MKERILFGRYIDRDSWVHRLDPRAKISAMPLFMAAVFLTNSYFGVLAIAAFAVSVMLVTRIPLSFYARAIKPLLFLILFIFLFHLLFDTGGKRLIELGPVALYSGGMEKAVVSAMRMTTFIAFAAILTFTTQPDQLATAFGRLIRPLGIIGVNAEKIALMLRVSLRFIPTIFEEGERLYKAQVSRGLSLTDQSLVKKARLLVALLVPVTAAVFRRAVILADSMEARGYRLDGERTSYRAFHWRIADTFFLLWFAVPITASAML